LEITLDARHKIDGVDRRGVAGELEIQGDGLLKRLRNHDFWRRRRDVGVPGVAPGEEDAAHHSDSSRESSAPTANCPVAPQLKNEIA
jgi:hypothetical protein